MEGAEREPPSTYTAWQQLPFCTWIYCKLKGRLNLSPIESSKAQKVPPLGLFVHLNLVARRTMAQAQALMAGFEGPPRAGAFFSQVSLLSLDPASRGSPLALLRVSWLNGMARKEEGGNIKRESIEKVYCEDKNAILGKGGVKPNTSPGIVSSHSPGRP